MRTRYIAEQHARRTRRLWALLALATVAWGAIAWLIVTVIHLITD
jgi:hypothetical protein